MKKIKNKKFINHDILKIFSVYILEVLDLPLWFIKNNILKLGKEKSINGKLNLARVKRFYNNSEAYSPGEYAYAQAVINKMDDFNELVSFFNSYTNKSILLHDFIKKAVTVITKEIINKNIVNDQFITLLNIMENVIRNWKDIEKFSSYFSRRQTDPNKVKEFSSWLSKEVYFNETREMLLEAWLETADCGEKSETCLRKILSISSIYSSAHKKAREALIIFYTNQINGVDRLSKLYIGNQDKKDFVGIAMELKSPELLEVIIKRACVLYTEDKTENFDYFKKIIELVSPENHKHLKIIIEAAITREDI